MKNILLLLITGCFFLNVSGQSTFTARQWQEDLKFLQNTVHQDYHFLFKKVTAEEWDNAVEELYRKIPNLSDHEVNFGFARIIGMFKYGHTRLGLFNNPTSFSQLPINMYHFSDGIYVQGVHKDYAAALGARVTGIGDMSVENALKAVYPVVPVENEQFFKAYGLLYMVSPEVLHTQGVIPEFSDTVEIRFEKNGKEFSLSLKATDPMNILPKMTYGFMPQSEEWLDAREQSETPLYLKNLDKIYYYEYLPEHKTVYVRQSQIQDEASQPIPQFYQEVFNFIENNDVERLVLDVRLNGGGNNYKNKPIVAGIIETEKINKVGKFFVIIGRRTFSACQNLVNELDNYTNAIFIGEPTGENINFYGDNNEIILPNTKLPVYLSFAWWQDKPQWENDDWLAPHIAIDMSFEDYRANRDPVLDVALGFSGDDFVLDPMQYMTDLYMAGEQEKLMSEVKNMIEDPRYKFFDFEAELNDAGYKMLNSNSTSEAIAVFSFVTQLFPDSPNAWDSLAEGYLKAGDASKAKDLYTKAYNMDPKGPTGRNSKRMLNEIERGQ